MKALVSGDLELDAQLFLHFYQQFCTGSLYLSPPPPPPQHTHIHTQFSTDEEQGA